MMPENIDSQKVQLIGITLFSFGVAWTMATYLLRQYLRRLGWVVVLLYVLVTVGGIGYISGPYALLALLFFACSGTPLLIGYIIQVEKADGEEKKEYHAALSEDRNAAS